jgi:aspartate ammonia-lyase
MAAEAGQLELNAFEPVIAYSLFRSTDLLGRACQTLAKRCIDGITANTEQCRQMVENSIGLATALNPYLGYEKSTEIAAEALRTGQSVYEVVLGKGYLSKDVLDDLLSPEKMTRPRSLM